MFTTCFAKFCHLCVTLYCRPARLCVSYLRNNLVVCSTREEVCSCVRAEKEFGRVLDLIESLVVCSTRERVWSCVRPEREFGRVFDPRESLVVCSTRERVWSCVRPEREFGRVFDPRKSFVVCWTRERVWSCVRLDREFGVVFDFSFYCFKENFFEFSLIEVFTFIFLLSFRRTPKAT